MNKSTYELYMEVKNMQQVLLQILDTIEPFERKGGSKSESANRE